MSSHQVLILVLIALALFILPAFGLYFMFKKAGAPAWKGVVPILNSFEMLRLSKRPMYLFVLQFIPVVGWFFTLAILVEFVKTFGKFRFYQHALTVCSAGLYFIYVGLNKKDKYIGADAAKKYKKSAAREWVDAGIFAVIAATLIRTFVFEAYVIPTPSMEKTLLVNDFLFVSKFSYGPRIPNTPIAMPFVHHTMPFFDIKSYVEWIHIPYTRWFASPVKRNDVVVFNFPAGDTVINREEYQSAKPYYDAARDLGNGDMNAGRKIILGDPDSYPIIIRPVDKKENFIKRCVGVAGDTLQIKDQVIYINGQATNLPDYSETNYIVTTAGQQLDETVMKDEYDVDINDGEEFQQTGVPNRYAILLTAVARDKMIKSGLAKNIIPYIDSSKGVFPYDPQYNWTKDNYGPFWIPKKGSTMPLTALNYPFYERVIRDYEKNKLEIRNGKIFINDKEATEYTFKMDYYWMMGDNRHQSLDSRYWGFVPEDHVVGEAWMIWLSWKNGVRWSRLFKKIK
ncbi:MAG TPA: S26 family signal peptidase [Puia sp.]|jgi:signal peptidase I|nr:S26 family signal peptidase [Puia sp.]